METKRIGLSPNANHKTSQLNTYLMINHFKIFAHCRLLSGIGEKNHRGAERTEDDGPLRDSGRKED
jgi:hypothetical protein